MPAASLVDISEPADGARFSSGEEIKLVLGLRGELMPDSVKVYFDGTALATLKGGVLEYTVETASARLGRIPLKVMAWEDDKRAQVLTHFITIISDIEPELYGYRIINMYPHDRKAYTQGLIYKDG
ncbi:MAG: glutaminyl-peptide cyclotransferase, partial [Bacteroidales bacterium]